MLDKTTNIQELKDIVKTFVEERGWSKFHNPKNLSMSIAIEAAELMELYQWHDVSGDIDRVQEELADVVIYCLSLANTLEIDLTQAIRVKMVANVKKYPATIFPDSGVGNPTPEYSEKFTVIRNLANNDKKIR